MKDLFDITGFLGMPDQASAHAHEIDYAMGLVHLLMLVLAVGWGAYFIYTLFRFRSSKNPAANYIGAKGRFSSIQETAIVVAEIALLFGFAIPKWHAMKDEFPVAEQSTVVHVVAEQFAWNIHYPGPDGEFGRRSPELVDTALNPLGLDRDDPKAADDIATVNELHLPVNKPAIIQLSSKDVIHSFALPEMRVKQDAIPGLQIPVWFVPTVESESEIGCAQLCGPSHYRMRGYLTVESQAEFDAWLQEQADLAS